MAVQIVKISSSSVIVSPRLRIHVALGLLFVAAIAVRLVHLSTDPIWFDEAATMGIAAMDWATILGPMAEVESSPPGYYILAKLWTLVFGSEITGLRLVSVLAGAASVPVIWLVARRAFSETEAWIAAAFIALAASQVRLSQDARCYAVVFLVTTLSMLVNQSMVQHLREARPAWRSAVTLGLLMGALIWLHATAGFIVLALFAMSLVTLLPDPRILRPGLLCLLVTGAVTAICAAAPITVIIRHLLLSDNFIDRWIEPQGFSDVARLYGRTLAAPFLGAFSPIAGVLQTFLIAAAAVRWWHTRSWMIAGSATMLLTAGIALPVVSQFVPVLLDRTALFLLAPLAVLIAAGAASLPHRVMTLVVAILLGLQMIGVIRWHGLEVRKERWDLAAEALGQRMHAGEPVIITESAFLELSLAASMQKIGAPVPRVLLVVPSAPMEELAAEALRTQTIKPGADLVALMTNAGAVWLVMRDQPTSVDHDSGFTSRAAVRDALTTGGGVLAERITWPGVEIERWAPASR